MPTGELRFDPVADRADPYPSYARPEDCEPALP